MRVRGKVLSLLICPLMLTLASEEASAKKKKKKPPEATEAPATTPAADPPAASATAGASVGADAAVAPAAAGSTGAAVSVDASVGVGVPGVLPGATPPDPTAPGAPGMPVPIMPPRPKDGVRFRGGVSLGVGGEFVSGYALGLLGLDGRLGVQINNLAAVFAQLHLSGGGGKVGNLSVGTATFAASVMADFTIINRIFVGAGAGFGVLNAPYGPLFALRFGGYPVLRFSEISARRKALSVGMDLRTFFLSDVTGLVPVVQFIAGVGYEAF